MTLWCTNVALFLLECMLTKQPLLSEGKSFRVGVAMFMVEQLACMVSIVAWTTNRNNTGASLSPCLTPDIELKINSASSILILILTALVCILYIRKRHNP